MVASLAYRFDKVVANAPRDFGNYDAGTGVRTPAEILSHMSDVLIWATEKITGAARQPHLPGTWDEEVARFRGAAQTLNLALADWNNPDDEAALRLVQGPLADALTHVGQLAMLSRMAGQPIAAESFYDAPIAALERTRSE